MAFWWKSLGVECSFWILDERIKACYTKDNKERNLIFKGRFFFEIDIFEKMSSIEFLFFLVGKNDLESEAVFYSLNFKFF